VAFYHLNIKLMEDFLFKEETYKIIGICMEVQKTLGYGFSEVIYKDAIEQEFVANDILYCRESEMLVYYKGKRLEHKFISDFVVFEEIIVEIKSTDKGISDDYIAQTLNYLRVSGNNVGLIINFGKRKLEYKRLIVK
jgi:GxxExxY protein